MSCVRTQVSDVVEFRGNERVKRFDDAPTISPDAKRELAWRQNGVDMVSAEVEQMLRRRGSQGLPEGFPKTIAHATAWLLDYLLDPPAEDETIRRIPAFTGFAWLTPYRDRAVYLAAKFLGLPPDDQQDVLFYREKGIRWRGDDVAFLARIDAARSGDEIQREHEANGAVRRLRQAYETADPPGVRGAFEAG